MQNFKKDSEKKVEDRESIFDSSSQTKWSVFKDNYKQLSFIQMAKPSFQMLKALAYLYIIRSNEFMWMFVCVCVGSRRERNVIEGYEQMYLSLKLTKNK